MQDRPNNLSKNEVDPELWKTLNRRWQDTLPERLEAEVAPIDVDRANWYDYEGKMVTLEFPQGATGIKITGLLGKYDGVFHIASATAIIEGLPVRGNGQPLEAYLVCMYCIQPMQCMTKEGISPMLWQCINPECLHKGEQYQTG